MVEKVELLRENRDEKKRIKKHDIDIESIVRKCISFFRCQKWQRYKSDGAGCLIVDSNRESDILFTCT